jgi:hypothetical protein
LLASAANGTEEISASKNLLLFILKVLRFPIIQTVFSLSEVKAICVLQPGVVTKVKPYWVVPHLYICLYFGNPVIVAILSRAAKMFDNYGQKAGGYSMQPFGLWLTDFPCG